MKIGREKLFFWCSPDYEKNEEITYITFDPEKPWIYGKFSNEQTKVTAEQIKNILSKK